ncbi:hypothetical protein HNQ64_000391 [Prosthecobacter dejongeii]|uniref:Helix-turn-helix domain-containing protein n=1 Tax=Prosthecobacter dejongeii TaxID=48465 RepID=A0A7W7YHC8_9BACT|nr:hypothetical protein [Prosthecobacter dejongeii]
MKIQNRKSKSLTAPMIPSSDQTGEVLLIKADEVCRRLGGISSRTLRRLEDRGLIRSLPLLRHRLFAVSDVNKLVEGLIKW